MDVLNYWTFCLTTVTFLTLHPRFSTTFNDTISTEASPNATWGGYIPTTGPRIKHELHIAGFFNLDSRNGAGSLEAARMAVEEINNDSRYLEDYKIELHQQRSTQVQQSFSFSFYLFSQGQVDFQLNLAVPFVSRSLLKVLKQVVEIACDQ